MTNVVSVDFKPRATTQTERLRRLAETFARHRRVGEDVLWLKENAEFLNVLETGGAQIEADALSVYDGVYDRIAERMAYFPQYYRFFIALALDLEALTGAGDIGQSLVDYAAQADLVGAELSDLQRAEARRLMLRRGVDPVCDAGLNDRLRAFAARPATFALPNKKAAYELTHIVFYLSEYGRVTPDLPEAARTSLEHAGTLAMIEMNADLLSEICVALRFAGWDVPETWEVWLEGYVRDCAVLAKDGTAVPDGYHQYLVTQWHAGLSGGAAFAAAVDEGPVDFCIPQPQVFALRELSRALMEDAARTGDWELARRRTLSHLSPATLSHLDQVAATSPGFDAFFEHFARVIPLASARRGLTAGFGA